MHLFSRNWIRIQHSVCLQPHGSRIRIIKSRSGFGLIEQGLRLLLWPHSDRNDNGGRQHAQTTIAELQPHPERILEIGKCMRWYKLRSMQNTWTCYPRPIGPSPCSWQTSLVLGSMPDILHRIYRVYCDAKPIPFKLIIPCIWNRW